MALPHARRRPSIAALASLAVLGMPILPEREAPAQQIARQFDQQSAGATQGPINSPFVPQSTSTQNFTPHARRAPSRPDTWPGAKKGGVTGDNHVLSSIRATPGAPVEPLDAADPADRPSERSEGVAQVSFDAPVDAEASEPVEETLDSTTVVARVGPEVVLEGDLLTPTALEWLAKVSPGMKPEQVRDLRRQICRQVLPQHVESLMVFVDACRTIPEDRLPEIRKKVNEAFDEQQLPQMVKQAGLETPADYDALLRSRGQSLERVRKMFFERALAQQWVQQKVKIDVEIPHAEMIAWYHGHLADYDFPAKARFEQLTVKVGAKRSRQEAWNMLAAMGNDVLEGRALADIARERSEGPSASTGGQYDWTTKGSLVSKVIDEAVFTLPVGQLSAILEEPAALHIVRVVERVDAGRIPFLEAQTGIKEQLLLERRKKEMDEYLAKLRERTPVWSIFDEGEGQIRQAAAIAPAAPRGGVASPR